MPTKFSGSISRSMKLSRYTSVNGAAHGGGLRRGCRPVFGPDHSRRRVRSARRHAVIKVGATIFADYTVQSNPKIKDADGNEVTSNAFNVTRTYINITGNINHTSHSGSRPTSRAKPKVRPPQRPRRQLRVPAQIWIRSVQSGRLPESGPNRIVGPPRSAADTLGRLHGRHLSLPVPGHDFLRTGRLPLLIRHRRVVSLQLRAQLRRGSYWLLQRRDLYEARG